MSISATTGRLCTAARRTLAIILLSSGLAILGAHPTLFLRSTTYALAISALAAAWGGSAHLPQRPDIGLAAHCPVGAK